jgi:hypothetical protein
MAVKDRIRTEELIAEKAAQKGPVSAGELLALVLKDCPSAPEKRVKAELLKLLRRGELILTTDRKIAVPDEGH